MGVPSPFKLKPHRSLDLWGFSLANCSRTLGGQLTFLKTRGRIKMSLITQAQKVFEQCGEKFPTPVEYISIASQLWTIISLSWEGEILECLEHYWSEWSGEEEED